MAIKDYYKILEVSPSATDADIKKSFRRLALKYHPDKNFGNELYSSKFKEVKEAYEILSDTKQRHLYNDQRKSQLQTQKTKTQVQLTPQLILQTTIDFRKKVLVLDPHRMNKTVLFQQLEYLLSKHNIAVLQYYNLEAVNKRIIEEIILCAKDLHFKQVESICLTLTALAGTDNNTYRSIHQFLKQVKRRSQWEKYKVFVAILFGLLLCFLVYLLSAV